MVIPSPLESSRQVAADVMVKDMNEQQQQQQQQQQEANHLFWPMEMGGGEVYTNLFDPPWNNPNGVGPTIL